MDKQIEQFLTYLYNFTHLPLYYYGDGDLLFCLPSEALDYAPPQAYLNAFCSLDFNVACQMTDFGGFFGFIRDNERNGFFIVGPCTGVNYDHHALFSMRKEYMVTESSNERFLHFLKSIPNVRDYDFMSQLSFINYCINHETSVPHDLTNDSPEDITVQKNYVYMTYEDKEVKRENNSLEIESVMLKCVENGDTEGLAAFLSSSHNVEGGKVGSTSLRNSKNYMIISVALTCRAAIRGGLSSETAFHLSDSYIQQMEASNSIEQLSNLGIKMLTDYTERVARSADSLQGDPILKKVIKFVQQNINQPITVSDAARHVGLSRGYLSTYFKETLGFNLSSFIRRCKLEEAKELLRYSDRSISEISEYLCFSSQSHFQNSFKKQYNITPQKYRKGME